MARTIAELPKGTRITDYISLGVLASTFPLSQVEAVLAAQKKTSRRQRDLPAHVVVYYVIALALFMQVSYREVLRCLLEGLVWLRGPRQGVKITGKSGISQARARLGWRVLQQLHDEVVKPLAVKKTPGAWYRGWRLVSLDGSTLEVADEQENVQAFGRPAASRGTSAYPQMRFVSLVENGTHVLFGTHLGSYATGEITLAPQVMAALYHERWEIEGALDELKTHLRGAQIILRSKTPDLVRQEFYGLLLAHFAIRGLMHEAALQGGEDPDRLSFLHAVRVVRRKLPLYGAVPPSGEEGIP